MKKFTYALLFSTALAILPLYNFAQFGFEQIDTLSVENSTSSYQYPWMGGLSHAQFSNIDVNFDGTPDLYVFDRADNSSHVYLRNSTTGDVNFTYVDSLSNYFPKDLRSWVLLRDYNCDGKMDIFSSTPGGFSVYRNDGDATNGLTFTKVTNQVKASVFGNQSNLYVSSADIPAIEDIDNDGDLDVLTFDVAGTTIAYYRNFSVETYGVCDSLNQYELKNECWGLFSEGNTDNSINLNETNYPCNNPNITNPELPVNDNPMDKSSRHSGSTILGIDYDNSGVYDLVLGDISFNNLVYLENGGATVNSNSAMNSVDSNFPSNTTPVDLELFPASFYVDVTNDGNRDLLVSSNTTVNALDNNSIWYYENIGTDAEPNFIFRQEDFLQDNTFSNGTRAFPVFFDHNQDGLQDLIIGNYRYYDEVSNGYKYKLQYYENVGTASTPSFRLISTDYQNMSADGFNGYIIPAFADLDGDSDEDMIIGETTGNVHYYENGAGVGNPANFNLTTSILEDDDNNPISASTYSAPELVDLNRDGLIDLVLGRKDGKLSYYENVGTTSNFIFKKMTDNLGGVNTTEYLDVSGYSVPEFVDHNGEYHLFLGSKSGRLYYYNDIDNNISGNFNLVDSIALGIDPGEYTGLTIGEIYNTKPYTMIMGTSRGGLKLYQNNDGINIGIEEHKEFSDNISIYPNPSEGVFNIEDPDNIIESYQLYNLNGQIVIQNQPFKTKQINANTLSKGVYILQLFTKNQQSVLNKKIVIK